MFGRRRFLKTALSCAWGLTLAGRGASAASPDATAFFLPEEGEEHLRTWMAFGASRRVWGRGLLPEARRDLATLANTIARYEPVTMLVRTGELGLARSLLEPSVELVECPLDDLWIRDSGPVFVVSEGGGKAAIDFNFNGWGEKQEHGRDAKVAAIVAELAGVPVIGTELVLEGGSLEVDGQGTGILTESCVLHGNRNPGVSKAQLEDLLMPLIGLEKILWLPGIRDRKSVV